MVDFIGKLGDIRIAAKEYALISPGNLKWQLYVQQGLRKTYCEHY